MTIEVQIHCLGNFAIDGLPKMPKGHKQTALLAYLACNLGKPCSRSKLASIFWGDRFDDQARQSLRQALSSLGKDFQSCPQGLQIERDAVSLNPSIVSVDVIDAEAAIADGDLDLAATIFRRGPFLESIVTKDSSLSDWLTIERAKVAELARQAILGRAEQLYHEANPGEAEKMAAWWLQQDSFDEPALCLIMKAMAATGRISGAVKVYHRFKETLHTELGVAPSQKTTDCFDNLQRSSGPNSAVLDRPAVAVLPFINLSGEAEQEYFVDGLTEDIITELSYWRTFPVIARNSTFVYKGEPINPSKVAEELGAAFILEGSVRKSGSRIRVTAQLIDSKTSHHLWAKKFDREMSDVFELQDDLTRSIAAVIEPAIIRAEQNRVKSAGTRNIGAWDYYLRGNDLANQFTAEGHSQARRMFERALELDPNYAKPYVGISSTYLQGIALKRVDDHETAVNSVIEAASQAVELDDSDSSARVTLSVGYMWSGLYDQALAEARKAVECNPSNAFAYVSLGNILDVCGDPEQGIPLMEIGLKLNPLEPRRHFAMTWLAGAFLNARRYEKALAGLQRALSRQTDYPLTHLFKAVCLVRMNQLDEAREALMDCERADPGFSKEFLRWRVYKKDSDNEHMSEAIQKIDGPTSPFGSHV